MSENPTSIRNIPADALQIAQYINRRTGLSVADVLRQAMVVGTLIELMKAGPDPAGEYAGFDEAYLAKSLRRHLAAPIDFLLEQREHPYQAAFVANMGAALPTTADLSSPVVPPATPGMMFDDALVGELDDLGLGGGLAADLMADSDFEPATR